MVEQPRKTARFFQGAGISIAGVSSLGRSLKEFDSQELAQIVGYYMFHNSEPSIHGKLFNSSLGVAIQRCFPSEDVNEKQKREVGFYLRQNGYRAVGAGKKFIGWEIPDEYTWQQYVARPKEEVKLPPAEPVHQAWICQDGCTENGKPLEFESQYYRDLHHTAAHQTQEGTMVKAEQQMDIPGLAPIVENVTTIKKWQCVDCGDSFDTPQGLGGHRATRHPKATEVASVTPAEAKSSEVTSTVTGSKVYICPVCGRVVSMAGKGGHTRSHKMTKHQKELLRVIKEHPGLHPRDYAAVLNTSRGAISSLGKYLLAAGKIRKEGQTVQSRYYPKRGGAKPLTSDAMKAEIVKPLGRKPASKPKTSAKPKAATANGVEARKVLMIGDNILVIDGEVYHFTKKKLT